MTTTELTGAEDVAWDLSDLYESGDDPRIEADAQGADEAAETFRERYYGKVADLSAAELAEAIEERERRSIRSSCSSGSRSQSWRRSTPRRCSPRTSSSAGATGCARCASFAPTC